MKILLNDESIELEDALTVNQLLTQLDYNQPGSALAINQTIIPRNNWDTHILQDGDDVLLFQAIAGG
ncbi:sulfur carrier protein ThiS [Yersinia ruckeri]|uniref:Sulfur carrier protein ThiS n=1 Tax=Yersinia ruckeri TaxID=29486 RepID=A0A085U3W2_YERRU|nr:sulfur carrier protein ThiS [Yersinia ruckeri]AKA38477.1 thiamine biosynthesis protein ThiS [Yersinia ruckeri]ARY99636.1 sulfur carrier protein ThiS [Yersinia ruckeri]AUQ41290.1 sulfur carrier protein ThiS [Yersinia ruckeri]EKN3348114.1 sulfur carrier protein ThiS [Yersinia ruckeri]EKN3363346.1 sulfur carrier protein ThiS [Yersinia ruckeri]